MIHRGVIGQMPTPTNLVRQSSFPARIATYRVVEWLPGEFPLDDLSGKVSLMVRIWTVAQGK